MLKSEEWDVVLKAIGQIHDLGCAVVVFTPDDVQGFIDEDNEGEIEIDDETAADILACEAKYLEDQLIERGNLYLRERVEDFLALERKAAGV